MGRLGTLRKSQIWRKGEFDWVTDADRSAERVILRTIRSAYPDHSIQAEESAPIGKGTGWRWLVDPLDGTVNYMHSFPIFSVSIALARDGILEAGVVYDPTRDELFTARKGRGARLNGRRIRVSPNNGLDCALLSTGFPFRAKEHTGVYLKSFRRIFVETGSIRRAGSAALDLAYIACGRMDGFWEMALAPWDVGAGALLIREAGGVVTDFFGRDRFLDRGHILAGTPGVHRQLLCLLSPIFRGRI